MGGFFTASAEPPRVFEHPSGRWLRLGSCSRCGECCKGDPPPELFPGVERQIEGHCPLLRFDGERHACAGHQEHPFYFTGCHEHPRCPSDMAQTPSCSYRFVRLD